MLNRNKIIVIFAAFCCLNFTSAAYTKTIQPEPPQAKYPDYAYLYLGNDRFESFNRKVFKFNGALNKYAIRPVHIAWASVMPKYAIDRIQNATDNIEYPIRLASTLLQRDFKASGRETARFLTNTTLGVGGLFDPAKKLLKIEPLNEDMDQALSCCKCKPGPYLVIPILNSCCPRSLVGKLLNTAFNPSSYVATPVLAIVKAGIVINRTSYMQPISKMLESTYADPYDIAKKFYGLETYIKIKNYDRKEVLEAAEKLLNENKTALLPLKNNFIASYVEESLNTPEKLHLININAQIQNNEFFKEIAATTNLSEEPSQSEKVALTDIIRGGTETDEIIEKNGFQDLKADIELNGYNPQDPVTDAMRTALFEVPHLNDSIWSEISLWNRSFSNRIKTSSVSIFKDREDYHYRYIMQKDKNSPVAIIYPSIGEGITSHHSVVLAKIFYDAGYSVIIQGSHFQWEFVKSMPKEYRPGLPSKDADYLQKTTGKIVQNLEKRYNCKFQNKIVLGTSFGAMTALFLGSKEAVNDTLNITKYISINPPIELLYAMQRIDKNTQEWNKDPNELKNRVAMTSAKVININNAKDEPDFKFTSMPFSPEEAKLITGFIMHQKLSDLIFTLENSPKCKKCGIYTSVNNMNYQDYAQKYLLSEYQSLDELAQNASLYSITQYLKKADNYTIYHTLDDYLVNTSQLKTLKRISGAKTILLSNGSHLGYLYRKEFQNSLKENITLQKHQIAAK